jgi:hypothetical protein
VVKQRLTQHQDQLLGELHGLEIQSNDLGTQRLVKRPYFKSRKPHAEPAECEII